MYSVFDVSNWFLQEMSELTNKKLQKMVYYSYAWHLVFSNESSSDLSVRLFPNEFEAWIHGVVTPTLYNKYKEFGSGYLPVYNGHLQKFSSDELDVLQQVKTIYGKYNGNQLESINHQETPWLAARNGLPMYAPSHNRISDKVIFDYYSARLS